MADRMLIGVQNGAGFRATYYYNGGAPDWNGVTLLQHFRTPQKVNQLLDGGPMSTLGPTAGTPPNISWRPDDIHAAQDPTQEMTRHYRDNDDNRDIEFTGADTDDFWDIEFFHGPDYYYLLTPEGWHVSCKGEEDRPPEPLAPYLVQFVEQRIEWQAREVEREEPPTQ